MGLKKGVELDENFKGEKVKDYKVYGVSEQGKPPFLGKLIGIAKPEEGHSSRLDTHPEKNPEDYLELYLYTPSWYKQFVSFIKDWMYLPPLVLALFLYESGHDTMALIFILVDIFSYFETGGLYNYSFQCRRDEISIWGETIVIKGLVDFDLSSIKTDTQFAEDVYIVIGHFSEKHKVERSKIRTLEQINEDLEVVVATQSERLKNIRKALGTEKEVVEEKEEE